jgi:hypothetical protein
MKKLLMILTLSLSLNLHAENNQTKKMSDEDVNKWFKEYKVIIKEGEKLEVENKRLKKLNHTLDELNGMLGVDK